MGLVVSACDARPDVFIVSFSERLMLPLCLENAFEPFLVVVVCFLHFHILCPTHASHRPPLCAVGRAPKVRP